MAARIVVWLVSCLTLAACGTETLEVPAPVARTTFVAPVALPAMSPSVVDAPISYALEPALNALEQAVPRRFGNINRRIPIQSNSRQQVAFEATRTPFRVAFDGTGLKLPSVWSLPISATEAA